MTQVENDIKKEFMLFREVLSKEVYLLRADLFEKYVNFIKEHPFFIEEIFYKKDDKIEVKVKYKTKITPSLEERGVTPKDVMQKAKKVADDEFYTRYEDIEKEVLMYDKNIWKDKCVFCNCDDAVDNDDRRTSAFALFFLNNFKELGLKKLICTHYSGGIDLFNAGPRGYIFTKEGFSEIKDDYDKMKEYPKGYDGSFDHPLSIKILNEDADIVCTNPPFSRARDYWKLVIESGKQFLILSNQTNVKNQPYMSFLKIKKVWPGFFRVPWYENPKRVLVLSVGWWYTNLPINDRPNYKHIKIVPLKKIPDKYKKFDDVGTLLVDRCWIPEGYKYPFAVSTTPILNGLLEKGYKYVMEKEYVPYIDGKRKFGRVLVQKIDKGM